MSSISKKDLRNGMRVLIRNYDSYKVHYFILENKIFALSGSMYSDGMIFRSLDEYDDDLKHKERPALDIIEVWQNDTAIWARDDEEVNWEKVKVGTPVLVRDLVSNDWKEAIFIKCNPNSKVYKYEVVLSDGAEFDSFKYCKINHSKIVKDVLKENTYKPFEILTNMENIHCEICTQKDKCKSMVSGASLKIECFINFLSEYYTFIKREDVEEYCEIDM